MASREPSVMRSKPLAKSYESSVWSVIFFGYDAWVSTKEFSLNVSVCCSLVSALFGKGSLDLFAHLYHIVRRAGFTVQNGGWISIRIARNLSKESLRLSYIYTVEYLSGQM